MSSCKVTPIKDEKSALPKPEEDPIKFNSKGAIYKILFSNPVAWIASLVSFSAGLCPLALFYCIGKIIDSTINSSDPNYQLNKYGILLAIVVVVTTILIYFDTMLWIRLGSYVSNKIKKDLYTSLMYEDVEFFDKTPIGSLLTMLSEDIACIQNAFGVSKGRQIQNFSAFPGAIILTFCTIWEVGFILIISIPLIIISLKIWRNGIIRDTMEKFKFTTKSITIAQETISSIKNVKGFNREEEQSRLFIEETKESSRFESRVSLRVCGMSGSIMLINFSIVALCVWFGGVMLDKRIKRGDKSVTIGDLFTIIRYQFLGSAGFSILVGTLQAEQKAIAAGDRIYQTIHHKAAIPYEGGRIIEDFKGNIKFNNVKFRYPTRPAYVLKNVSFEIKSGQTAAFVGHSGSGKSTCVQLLERYYDVEEGEILFDGINIKELDPRWLHRQFSLVSQEPLLFHRTIKENITYGLDNISDKDVISAAEAANASNFIAKLPNQYDEIVGEKGSTLSGGQRQRIAIARAVLKKPVVLIADEATSALDSKSEKKVQQALDNLLNKLTGIIVAHRLSTISNADIIFVFKDGEVVEQGTHQELLDNKSTYYNLVKKQLTSDENNQDESSDEKKDIENECDEKKDVENECDEKKDIENECDEKDD